MPSRSPLAGRLAIIVAAAAALIVGPLAAAFVNQASERRHDDAIAQARTIADTTAVDDLNDVRTDVDTTGDQVLGLILRVDRNEETIAGIVDRLDAIEHRLTELDRYLRAQRIRPASYTAASTTTATVDGHELPRTLRRIGGCESVWNPDGALVWTADNPAPDATASGAFGVTDPTWRSWARTYGADVGAARYTRALHAPPAVQVAVVRKAFAAQGTTPWRASADCWA